jgi:hypothetical protein
VVESSGIDGGGWSSVKRQEWWVAGGLDVRVMEELFMVGIARLFSG